MSASLSGREKQQAITNSKNILLGCVDLIFEAENLAEAQRRAGVSWDEWSPGVTAIHESIGTLAMQGLVTLFGMNPGFQEVVTAENVKNYPGGVIEVKGDLIRDTGSVLMDVFQYGDLVRLTSFNPKEYNCTSLLLPGDAGEQLLAGADAQGVPTYDGWTFFTGISYNPINKTLDIAGAGGTDALIGSVVNSPKPSDNLMLIIDASRMTSGNVEIKVTSVVESTPVSFVIFEESGEAFGGMTFIPIPRTAEDYPITSIQILAADYAGVINSIKLVSYDPAIGFALEIDGGATDWTPQRRAKITLERRVET